MLEHRWNHGASASFSDGLELSRGKYVVYVDSDDIVSERYLMVLYQAAEKTGADIVQAGYQTHPESQEEGKVFAWTQKPVFLPDTLQGRVNTFLPLRIHLAQWCKIFRRAFLDEHRLSFFDVPVAPDVSFHFKCVLTAKKYLVLPDILYHYRVHPGSVDSVRGIERAERYTIAIARILEEFSTWVKQEPLFEDIQVQRQLREVLYIFCVHQLRDLAKTCGVNKVYDCCKKQLALEPHGALLDAMLYHAISMK